MPISIIHYTDIENIYDDPPHLGEFVNAVEELKDDGTLVVGTGDNVGLGGMALVNNGKQSIDLFEEIETDYETFGNHDLDYGLDSILEIVANTPQAWLNANIYQDGEIFGREAGVLESDIKRIENKSVGFFGLTTQETKEISLPASSLTFRDPFKVAKQKTKQLKDKGVDYIVVLSHLGVKDDKLAREIDVDAILGGHRHKSRVDNINNTILTRPEFNGGEVAKINLAEDTARRYTVSNYSPDKQMTKLYEKKMSKSDLDKVLTTLKRSISREKGLTYFGECRIGNWVVDVYRKFTGADLALKSSGAIRCTGRDLHGEVTYRDLINVVPFNAYVREGEVSGKELFQVCQEADGRKIDHLDNSRWYGQVSGMKLEQTKPGGEIVPYINGEKIDLNSKYTIAASEYEFTTDHEFPTLKQKHITEEYDKLQYEMLSEYAKEHGIEAELDGRLDLELN
ncbi:MAG: bifunctional UDP-sugar hydrolase/5'-nucleotidase [Candidatus Paceibacteria bacterium]